MFFIGTKKSLTSRAFLMHLLPAGAVLITVLGLSVLGWRNAREAFQNERDALTANFARDVELRVSDRLNSYDLILAGAASLFTASENVTRAEWKSFVASYDLDNKYPGIRGVGFARYAGSDAGLSSISQEAQQQGIGNFRITTGRKGTDHAINFYFEPTTIFPLGYDLMSDSQRSQDITYTKNSGSSTLTGRRNFGLSQQGFDGFTMFTPIYASAQHYALPIEQRTINGFAYAPVESQPFFERLVGNGYNQKFAVRIQDASDVASSPLFESPRFGELSSGDHYTHSTTMQLYGRKWVFEYVFDESVISDATRNRPLISIIAGVLLSLLLSGFVLTLLAARTRVLSHSQEMEVQSAKDELLSLASHQLRTPATSVKQYIGMLMEGFAGKLSKSQLDLLNKAYESNERQLHIINELLYVAKIDAKGIVLTPRKLNLNQLIKEVSQDFSADVRKNKQRMLLDLPSRTVYAEADEHCLRMSLENLINNAIKYSPPHRAVTIRMKSKKNEVEIAVKDRGIGIEQDDLPLLFKQFSRIPNEFSVKSSGSGIGLYLSQQLIHLHGGEITVDSTPNVGSTFTIHLPKKQPKDFQSSQE